MSRRAPATRWSIRRSHGSGWLPLRWLGALLIALIVTLPGCAMPETTWESRDLVGHPPVGRIWDVQAEQVVTVETLAHGCCKVSQPATAETPPD